MGKVAKTAGGTAAMKNKSKEGRPSKNSFLSTPKKLVNQDSSPATNRRSGRRDHGFNDFREFASSDDEDDDERKEKKVKLVVRLPQSQEKDVNQNIHQRHSRDANSGSESDPELEDHDTDAKRRKISVFDRGSKHSDSQEVKKVMKVTGKLHGSPLDSGPTKSLPDKTLLAFILDRLQKKDTYGVFSEPVDPNELPDYFEIIEQPMDFGTVRKKLAGGVYKNLEELEADVFLICSNAMQYNAPDTVYYRQARSIQELAKRNFENLKHEGDDGEPQPKVVRRGRPPSKNQKKIIDSLPLDHVGLDLSSSAALDTKEEGAPVFGREDKGTGTPLTSGEDKVAGSYNLRNAPQAHKFRSTDPIMSSFRSRNGENYSEWLSNWSEFPASILRADMKYGNKQFTVDENRRDTYRQFHPLSSDNESPVSLNTFGNLKQLVRVGLQEPLAYARSLARFAANLGPMAWIVASKKIRTVLPSGIHYGPGWVGENATSQPRPSPTGHPNSSDSTANICNSGNPANPLTSDSTSVSHKASERMAEDVRKLNDENKQALQGSASLKAQFQTPQNVYLSNKNGFNGMFNYGPVAVMNEKSVTPPSGPSISNPS